MEASRRLRPNLLHAPVRREHAALAVEIARRQGDGQGFARWQERLNEIEREAAAREARQRGLAAYQAGDVSGTVAWLTRSLELAEAQSDVHGDLAQVYLAMRRPDDAVREARRAVELDPRSAPAACGLGAALVAQGDRVGAAGAFERCLENEPNGFWAVQASQGLAALGNPR